MYKIPINYSLNGGGFTGPNTIIGKMSLDGEILDLPTDVNFNSVTLKINDKNYDMILTTGHSVNYPTIVIDNITFTKKDNIKEIINGNYFYCVNNGNKDFALIYSPDILKHLFKITLDYEYVQAHSLRLFNNDSSLVKNGCTTKLTWGEILLDLSKDTAKNIIENNKIIKNGESCYKINGVDNFTLLFNIKSLNGIDYIIKPSVKYYEYRTKIPDQTPNIQMISCIKVLNKTFNLNMKDDEIDIFIKTNNIGEEYYSQRLFGWLSLQGDSGSGYYKIIDGNAHLIGINLSGAFAITLVSSDEKHDTIHWDPVNKKIKIKEWKVESFYKCSVVAGIDTIEKYIRDESNDQTIELR